MAEGVGKCSKIRHIVRLRQMLRRWRNKARLSSVSRSVPSDVPSGHVAVCVGSGCRRFVVRASYLNHPILSNLLVQAEEEYGFVNQGRWLSPVKNRFSRKLSGLFPGRTGVLVPKISRNATEGSQASLIFDRISTVASRGRR
ncbi:hypothetical protein Bca52824_076468 [Brassica carinata]|uniref:Uncharacterized protein n=1 Tax=Brassica carinata TaxID=52824 RepID=A0A8X7TXC6_BRACI|nr:hypothetical protein Bca52824_076468 [Brassica carinata]